MFSFLFPVFTASAALYRLSSLFLLVNIYSIFTTKAPPEAFSSLTKCSSFPSTYLLLSTLSEPLSGHYLGVA